MKKIIPHVDLVESVKNALFDAILTGEFLPGEKLAQDDLAEKMGVSRQPIIQALRILSEHGILCPHGKKGVAVSKLNTNKLKSLLQVRRELDCLAARLAAKRAKAKEFEDHDYEQIDNLKKLIALSHLQMKGDNHANLVRNDLEFHKMIRSLSGNTFIQSTLEPHLLHQSRIFYITAANRHQVIWEQHESIFEAILSGDATVAENLTHAHTVEAEELMVWYEDEICKNQSGL